MFLEQKKSNNLPGEITKASECPVWVKIPYGQPGNKTHSLCSPCSKLQPAAVAIPLPRSQASPPGSRHEQPEAAPHAPAGFDLPASAPTAQSSAVLCRFQPTSRPSTFCALWAQDCFTHSHISTLFPQQLCMLLMHVKTHLPASLETQPQKT